MFSISRLCYLAIFTLLLVACDEDRRFIEDISPAEAGADATAPEVTINFPRDGSTIQVLEAVTNVDISFEVVDDVEIREITIDFNGATIGTFTDFRDFRRYVDVLNFDAVEDGTHTITVTAEDVSGKTTSESVTFTKEPAYTPLYDGEQLYMPFDGDYIDLVKIERPTVVGAPGFAGEGQQGTDAYAGAENAHLEYPSANVLNGGNEVSAAFWIKLNADPNRAALLAMSPVDEVNPDNQNNRNAGFRLFREQAGEDQRFKLNIGRGDAETWFDGGEMADIPANDTDWHHIAISIGQVDVAVYIDGQIVSSGELPSPMSTDGTDLISIMSGAPRFIGWGHLSDRSLMDELRMFDRAISAEDVATLIEDGGGSVGYTPAFDGENFYASFNDGSFEELVTGQEFTVVGSPTITAAAREGMAYQGAEGAYLTYPTAGLGLGEGFSASFWMNINAEPNRAGILVAGPEDMDNPDSANNRSAGFRFFREAAGDNQRFKLNIGTGDGESWFDGGAAADIPASDTDWHHFAFSIDAGSATVYIDGQVVSTNEFPGISWDGVDVLSIMSGAPRFVGWDHRSDQSSLDDLRLFNKAISQEEVTALLND